MTNFGEWKNSAEAPNFSVLNLLKKLEKLEQIELIWAGKFVLGTDKDGKVVVGSGEGRNPEALANIGSSILAIANEKPISEEEARQRVAYILTRHAEGYFGDLTVNPRVPVGPEGQKKGRLTDIEVSKAFGLKTENVLGGGQFLIIEFNGKKVAVCGGASKRFGSPPSIPEKVLEAHFKKEYQVDEVVYCPEFINTRSFSKEFLAFTPIAIGEVCSTTKGGLIVQEEGLSSELGLNLTSILEKIAASEKNSNFRFVELNKVLAGEVFSNFADNSGELEEGGKINGGIKILALFGLGTLVILCGSKRPEGPIKARQLDLVTALREKYPDSLIFFCGSR